MAPIISLPLRYLLLFLLLAQLTDSALIPWPNSNAQHKPQPSKTYIVVHGNNHLATSFDFAKLEQWYTMVATCSLQGVTSRLMYTDRTGVHGVTGDEARVAGVQEHMLKQATGSLGFTGLDNGFGFGACSGADLINVCINIGFVETGTWPAECSSFNDGGVASKRDAISFSRILYNFDTAVHGLRVQITGGGARSMSIPGPWPARSSAIHRPMYLLATGSPGLTGLDTAFGGDRNEAYLGGGVTAGSSITMYTYVDALMHVKITGDGAGRVPSAPGVAGVYKGAPIYPRASWSLEISSLDEAFAGRNSATFDDCAHGSARPTWRGGCIPTGSFTNARVDPREAAIHFAVVALSAAAFRNPIIVVASLLTAAAADAGDQVGFTTAPPPPEIAPAKDGPSVGWAAAILVAAGLATAAVWLCRRRRRHRNAAPAEVEMA